jgi:hypothetical protein
MLHSRHLQLADGVQLVPVQHRKVALAAAEHNQAPAACEVQPVGPQLRQAQIEDLAPCSLLHLCGRPTWHMTLIGGNETSCNFVTMVVSPVATQGPKGLANLVPVPCCCQTAGKTHPGPLHAF